MTGRLEVRVECVATAPGERLTTLVGNVYAATPGNPSLRQVPLPMGTGVAPAAFALPAGTYVVQAELPSGQILTEEVVLLDGGSDLVQLELTDSPYESHALQYVLGSIEPGGTYHSPERYPVPASDGSRSFHRRDPGALPGPPVPDAPAEVMLLRRSSERPPRIDELAGLRELDPPDAVHRVAELVAGVGPPLPLAPAQPDPVSPIFRFDLSTLPSDLDGHPHCQYVTVAAAGDVHLVTVPWPWPWTGGDAAVDVMVNQRQSPTGSAVSVAVHDPAVGSGIGYLASGSLDKAAALLGDVESMLYGKVRNPLAAAAAGYVLIGTDHSGEPRRWDGWLVNLRDWFPGLSDGAVLWGARRLRTARTPGELDEAREALLEGYDRGLPVFTLGLSWLIDGLSAFPEDPKCAEALLSTRRLCWQVDMREPFVVLRLGGDR